MCDVEGFAGPGLARVVLFTTVKVHGVVERSSRDPFKLLRGIGVVCLDDDDDGVSA
jgi:hypothetical protein